MKYNVYVGYPVTSDHLLIGEFKKKLVANAVVGILKNHGMYGRELREVWIEEDKDD